MEAERSPVELLSVEMFFASVFCPALIGSMLCTSGVAHLLGMRRLGELLRAHDVLPAGLARPAAVVVTLLECGLGAASLWLFASGRPAVGLALALGGVGLAGAFLLYLVRLLRRGPTTVSCGCSPLSSPVTEASLVPAATLLIAALVLGLALLPGGDGAGPWRLDLEFLLPTAAGIVLAGLGFLVPASMPAPARGAVA